MRYNEFLARITQDKAYLNQATIDYNTYHARRFYKTFIECRKYLKKGDKLLSIGAGSAAIEKILSEDVGIEVTVLDFPDLIQYFKPYYDFLGFKTCSADLTRDTLTFPPRHFDMLLASEIIEHVPKSLYDQLKIFNTFLNDKCKVVITTPNLGSIIHISKLLLMQPIMPPAEKVFSDVGFDNQEVHRREYLPIELIDEFSKLGYKHVTTEYFYYNYPQKVSARILYALGNLIPRFKTGMLLVGEKRTAN